MQFKNPQNGHVESSSGPLSWLWCFLFGPIYFLFKGNYRHALIHFLIFWPTFGISLIVYPFFVYTINRNHYLRMGWIKVNQIEQA